MYYTIITIITGYNISDDSVIHALLSKGFAYTRSIPTLPAYYNDSYPRGFHSYHYYINSIINTDVKDTLLVSTLFIYSLIVYAILGFIQGKKYGFIKNLLVIAVVSTPFIVVCTAYHMFIAQIAVMPFLLASLFLTYAIKKISFANFLVLGI